MYVVSLLLYHRVLLSHRASWVCNVHILGTMSTCFLWVLYFSVYCLLKYIFIRLFELFRFSCYNSFEVTTSKVKVGKVGKITKNLLTFDLPSTTSWWHSGSILCMRESAQSYVEHYFDQKISNLSYMYCPFNDLSLENHTNYIIQ